MPLVDGLELRAFRLRFSVVREVVVAIRDGGVSEVDHGRADAIEHERDRAGGVGLEGEARQIIHDFHLFHVGRGIRRIDRHGGRDDGLRFAFPAARRLQAVLEVADAGEILVEAVTVAGGHAALEFLGLAGDGVEDAAAGIQFSDLGGDLCGRALDEQLLEDVGGFVLGRDGDAGAGPGEAA